MDKNTYSVDFKIFESVNGYQFKFYLPEACFSGEYTRPGYYTFDLCCTTDELQAFEFAVKEQGQALKIIGITQTSF